MAVTDIWNRLRQLVGRLLGSGADEYDRPPRTTEARERFWSELREGQREAEAEAKPKGT